MHKLGVLCPLCFHAHVAVARARRATAEVACGFHGLRASFPVGAVAGWCIWLGVAWLVWWAWPWLVWVVGFGQHCGRPGGGLGVVGWPAVLCGLGLCMVRCGFGGLSELNIAPHVS